MASISSVRKGRGNTVRTSDADLGNEIRVTGSFRNLIHNLVGTGEPPNTFAVELDSLSSQDPSILAKLDDTLSIEDGVTLPKGVVPVYAWKLFYRTSLLETGFVIHEASEPVLDIVRSQTATEEQISEAVNYEAPKPAPPKPAAIAYKIIPRTADDVASRLGFKVEPGEALPIKLAAGHTIIGVHIASPMIIGRIQTSLTFPSLSNAYLELALYNAAGDRRLYIEMTSPATQFDQIRLEAGDHLLVMRCVRGALEGSGSYHHPNARVIATLPTKPDLELLWSESNQLGPEIRCALPCFEFTSR